MVGCADGEVAANTSDSAAAHLVFVHGFLDDPSVWDATVNELGLDADHVTCVAVPPSDIRTDSSPLTPDHLAFEILGHIERQKGPLILVGHSMGAQIAELVAAALGDRVAALALLTPVPLGGMPLPEATVASFKSLSNDFDAQYRIRSELSAALEPSTIKDLATRGVTIPAHTVAALVNSWTGGSPRGNESTRYCGPVLVVRGADDPFISADVIAGTLPRFPGADTAVIDGAGHWPHIEQPRLLASALSDFLDRRTPRTEDLNVSASDPRRTR